MNAKRRAQCSNLRAELKPQVGLWGDVDLCAFSQQNPEAAARSLKRNGWLHVRFKHAGNLGSFTELSIFHWCGSNRTIPGVAQKYAKND